MEIKIPYGKDTKTVRIPPGVQVDFLAPEKKAAIADLQAALSAACRKPLGTPPLDEMLKAGGNVVVLVSDLTRGGGTELVLPLFIEYLRNVGISPASIKIVIARGTHRKLTKAEKQFFKKGPLTGVTVEEHDCDDPSNLSALMLTQRGTPVRVNVALKDAGTIAVVSPVSYHYFAGFGGGRKLVLPGCADRPAILANHRLSLVDSTPVTLHPGCRPGQLEGNPVHEDMCEAVEALGRTFCVNFFASDEGVAFINAGHVLQSHLAACEAYDKVHRVPIESPCDVMILSAGGFPYDINLLQSHKAIRNSAPALNDNASVLFLVECAEGIGSASLEAALALDKKKFLKSAYAKYDLNNQTAVSLHELTERFEIGMMSEMNVDQLLSWGIKPCVNAEAFIAEALEEHGADRIIVNLVGSGVLPQLQ
ncbi:MAG: nickel-dependent lactate racemase [bacterium]